MNNGISIIILSLNASDHLDRLMTSFYEINSFQPVELIIIDHGSTDNTPEIIEQYASRDFIRFIQRRKNYSFAKSCNLGASKALYPYLLFLNNDIIYTSDVLQLALNKLEENIDIGVVGIRLDDPGFLIKSKSGHSIQHMGIHFIWNNKRNYYQPEQIRVNSKSINNSLLSDSERQIYSSQLTTNLYSPAVSGAFLLCHKADFDRINGFCEDYNYGLEDIDLCLRFGRDLNMSCYCINELSLQHIEGATRMLELPNNVIENNHRIFKKRWDEYIRALVANQHPILRYQNNNYCNPAISKTIAIPKNFKPFSTFQKYFRNIRPNKKSLSVKRKYSIPHAATETHFLAEIEEIRSINPGFFERIKASVIMPTFNRSFCISSSIKSVLEQSHNNFELLIIDDGSTDETFEVVQSFLKDPRVHYKRVRQSGVSSARNSGLDMAKGDLFFFLDSDNTWESNLLSTMVVFLLHGELEAGYCGCKMYDKDGRLTFYRGDNFHREECLSLNYIDMNCFCHRRNLKNIVRFDEGLRRLVDWDYILKVTSFSSTSYAPFYGVNYYDGDTGERITHTEYKGEELKRFQEIIRRKHSDDDSKQNIHHESHPVWSEVISKPYSLITEDTSSKYYQKKNEQLINWVDLASKCRDRTSKLVSIVILCYNNAELTKSCIASIIRNTSSNTFNYEIIIVNNGSSDHTGDIISEYKSKHSNIKYIHIPENMMFSTGNNIGVAQSRGEYVVFLNNDTSVNKGWLDHLVTPLEENDLIGAVSPKLLYEDDTIQCCGLVFSPKSKIPYHVYRGFPRYHNAVNKPRFFSALTGACMGMRVVDFIQLRGFDPAFINGCEDLDLCFRITHNLQKHLFYNPLSEVFHLECKTEGRSKHIMRNRLLFVRIWCDNVFADDILYYKTDGFETVEYTKPGTEPHGETASYVPQLKELKSINGFSNGSICSNNIPEKDPVSLTKPVEKMSKVLNIGFSSIWHVRGITFHTLQLAKTLEDDHRFSTHIFARWESEKFSNEGTVYHPRVFNSGNDPSPDKIVGWAQKHHIDLMIFMEVHPKDWKRIDALKKAGIPLMCYENLDVLRLENWDSYAVFDYFLFNAFYARDVMLGKFPQTPSLMVPWGIPPKLLPQPDHSETGHPLRFVHVAGWGGVNNRKNSALALRAFHQADSANAELHFYTQTPITEYGEVYKQISETDTRIKIHEGTIDNIFNAYCGMDILLWPSKREGLGLPILEALACGLPVLVTDGYMMKQWIMAGKHGLLCPATPEQGIMFLPEMQVDERRLAEQITQLSDNPQNVQKMAESVHNDRDIWLWTWQPAVFRDQLSRIINNPDYSPPADLSYIPEKLIKFYMAKP